MKNGTTKMCYKFFTNLANPTRLAALELLMTKPMSVNELAASLGQEQSMVSHNLQPLLKCNFVNIEKQGKKRVYSVNQETVGTLFGAIENHAEKYCPSGGKCLMGES
jgi:DNA-binding transcriptional ArsR family regulator